MEVIPVARFLAYRNPLEDMISMEMPGFDKNHRTRHDCYDLIL